MIGRIRGKLVEKLPPEVLIDVSGVGYEIQMPMTSLYQLPELGAEVIVYTHFVVREDAQLLFGFADRQERALFRELIKANGVGPKMALTIMSGMTAAQFAQVVNQGDVSSLVKLPGVGKKTAERLLVEMKDRLKTVFGDVDAMTITPVDIGEVAVDSTTGSARDEAMSALLALGYKPPQAEKMLKSVFNDAASAEELIRDALKSVAQRPGPQLFMIEADRIISSDVRSDEEAVDRAIRPKMLADYTGQDHVCAQMEIFIQAARQRQDALDHLLIFGPPGLGKTTLANIVANELDVNIKTTSGPVLEKAGDLAAMLTNLEAHDVLFIDEIHRLSPVVEEVLYPAMEDYQLDIMIGEGPAARSIKLDLPPFTLIGATTRAGSLTSPLRDRFGIVQRLEFYNVKDLACIVARSARYLNMDLSEAGAFEIAARSRGTPRIANRLLRRVRDYSDVKGNGVVDKDIASKALDMLNVDVEGFDYMDRKLLTAILEKFSGGPVGLDNLAAAIGEAKDTIEDVIEPFLIQQGFLQRTPRGRIATQRTFTHFGLSYENPEQGRQNTKVIFADGRKKNARQKAGENNKC